MGCGADVTRHVTHHVNNHVMAHVNLHVIIAIYVNLHVIIAIYVIAKSTAMSSIMSLMCDMAIESVTKVILFVMFIFVIENGLGLGFGCSGTFYDGFKTSWIK